MQITATQQTVILAAAGYVATAAISTMPQKGVKWNWETLYAWLFDFAHTLLNMRRPTQDASK
jgi:hypothetical protein